MMKRRFQAIASALLVAGCTFAAFVTEAMAEQQTINAFSSWQARGQMFDTGPDQMTFVGSFAGMIYVDTEKGPLDAGYMICPAIFEFEVKSGVQTGKGHCAIATRDDERVYADLNCTGVVGVGCKGTFTLTAGTGKFEGVTGSGNVTIRSTLHESANLAGNTIEQGVTGIIYWRNFTFKLKE